MSYVGAGDKGDTGGVDKPKEVEAKEAVEAGPGDDVPMLRADVRDAAIEIVNQIGPDAFLVLSAASRNMRNFCLNTAGIKIDWNKGSVGVKKTDEGETQFIFFLESEDMINCTFDLSLRSDFSWNFDAFYWDQKPRVDVEKLRKMPFSIHLSRLNLRRVVIDAPPLAELENCLTGIPIKTIREVECEKVKCWPELLKLMTKYKVRDLNVIDDDDALPEDTLKAICALNLTSFVYRFDVPVNFISSMTLPYLYLRSDVSRETAEAIIQKAFSFPEFEEWAFGLNVFEDEFGTLFASHELLDFGHSGPLPERRPLVFVKDGTFDIAYDDSDLTVYILRADGKIVRVFFCFWDAKVSVMMCDYEDGPPALHALIDPQ